MLTSTWNNRKKEHNQRTQFEIEIGPLKMPATMIVLLYKFYGTVCHSMSFQPTFKNRLDQRSM